MYILGIDVGTTGTKARLLKEDGTVVAGGYKEYKLNSNGVKVTQNADDWWNAAVFAVKEAVKNIDKSQIKAISMSTQAASMLACDENGNALCDVITWMDSRAFEECNFLCEKLGSETIYKKTGWLPNSILDASKILWIKNKEPELFKKAYKFITTEEFMNYKLCKRFVIDPTNAAMRQIFNIKDCKWDSDILSLIGITEDRLPEIQPIGTPVGNLCAEAANQLGLSTDTVVYNGAHDQYCASLGCGAVNTGDMLLATGTTWVVLGVCDDILYTDNHICPGIHPAKGKYGALASLVSAGSALNWYKNIIDGDFRLMDEKAALRRDETANLFALPYLCGAGFPHNKPELRGSMFGLDVGHDKYHIVLAMMEGVAFEANLVLRQFADNGMNIKTLMMTGGAAKSKLWSSIVGYITGCDIYRMKEPETCCVGAAMIAAVGSGMYHDYSECRSSMVKSEKLELCDNSSFEFYKEKAEKYYKLVDMVKKL